MNVVEAPRLMATISAYGGLVVATAVAAYLLVDVNLLMWNVVNYDPQGFDQQRLAYETAGAFAYTAGATVGQTSSLAAGLLTASRFATAPRRGLVAAGVAGLGLWLSAFVAGLGFVRSSLPRTWMLSELADARGPFDPELLHDRTVITIIVLNLAGYLCAALLGYGLGLVSRHRSAAAGRALPRGVRFVAWSGYAFLVGCGLIVGLSFFIGVLNAPTVPRFIAATAVYGVVVGACIVLARHRDVRALAPLPLLLVGPYAAVAILHGLDSPWALLAPAVVAALAVWAAVVCWSAIRTVDALTTAG
jgi:hypothetical protein